MRTLPLLLRLADDMKRIALSRSPFYDDPWRIYRMASPWPELRHLQGADEAIAKIGKDGYQVNVDVADYKPSELTVKVVDNTVVVEGKHEERNEDEGFVSRQFVRRYQLPDGFDPNKVVSSLSSDGVLTVTVPKPQIENKAANERLIQIQQTGPAHLNVKENPAEDATTAKLTDSKKDESNK